MGNVDGYLVIAEKFCKVCRAHQGEASEYIADTSGVGIAKASFLRLRDHATLEVLTALANSSVQVTASKARELCLDCTYKSPAVANYLLEERKRIEKQ